jgi:hypothetical protein
MRDGLVRDHGLAAVRPRAAEVEAIDRIGAVA